MHNFAGFPQMGHSSFLSAIWGDILKVEIKNPALFKLFISNVGFKVGRGDKISFWNDDWLGNGSLRLQYPRLFSLSMNKEGRLIELVKLEGEVKRWELLFRRRLFV